MWLSEDSTGLLQLCGRRVSVFRVRAWWPYRSHSRFELPGLIELDGTYATEPAQHFLWLNYQLAILQNCFQLKEHILKKKKGTLLYLGSRTVILHKTLHDISQQALSQGLQHFSAHATHLCECLPREEPKSGLCCLRHLQGRWAHRCVRGWGIYN